MSESLTLGVWIAVPGPFGMEAGQVVARAGSVAAAAATEEFPRAGPALEPGDVTEALRLAQVARTLIPAVARQVEQIVPGTVIAGLRFTLDGRAVCTCSTPEGTNEGALELVLADILGQEVRLDRVPAVAAFGTLGRVDEAQETADGDGQALARLKRLGAYPHLGTAVRAAGGTGVLVSVSVRHAEARIRMAGESEVVVPTAELEDLTLPGDERPGSPEGR